MLMVEKPKGFGACPTFFFASCLEASQGGRDGYQSAARSLVRSLGGIAPHEVELDEWSDKLDELQALIVDGRDDEVLSWFDRWLPRCMALVPRQRRRSFLKGIYRYVVDEGNAIEM
jgi:hypothetical protein